MDLKIVSLQELNGSYFVYLPKIWVKNLGMEKGDKITCIVEEGSHEKLILKRENDDAKS